MTKRTNLLAASLFSFLSIHTIAACTGGNTDTGSTAGSGSAGVSGSAAGANASGGVGTVSGSPAVGETTATTGSTGSTAGSTGSTTSSSGSKGGTGSTGSSKGGAGSAGDSKGGTGSAGGGTGGSTGGTGSAGGSKGGTGSAGGSTVKCTLPTLPDAASLTANPKLPDPFTFFDGTKVTTKDQWECRRQEILAMAAKYIYGPVPSVPDDVAGTVTGGTVSITVKVGTKTETFSASITGTGNGAIALELSGGIFPSSHKTLTFGTGFEAKIKSLFGLSELNTNVANGWMIDRVMDVLEKNPTSGHDPTKVMVSGCSGCGKGAFLAGIFSRAPLVVIVESGGGGAASLRQAEWFRHGEGKSVWQCTDDLPQSIDNLESNGICGPWITGAAKWLTTAPAKVKNLPFDQHLLLATIAPRYLLHFSNSNGKNSWCHLGGTCEALSAWAAKPVWKALGVPERMGFHQYSAQHCGNPAEAITLAGEFFKRAFDGSTTAKTDVMDIMASGVQQPVADWKTMWVDWDMDTALK